MLNTINCSKKYKLTLNNIPRYYQPQHCVTVHATILNTSQYYQLPTLSCTNWMTVEGTFYITKYKLDCWRYIVHWRYIDIGLEVHCPVQTGWLEVGGELYIDFSPRPSAAAPPVPQLWREYGAKNYQRQMVMMIIIMTIIILVMMIIIIMTTICPNDKSLHLLLTQLIWISI